MNSDFDTITETLQKGGIAIVRTDTIYGVIALASDETAVEKVYRAKSRNPAKQCIVLVVEPPTDSDYRHLVDQYSAKAESPTSVVVPVTNEPEWLTRGSDTIAYRVVRDPFLRSVVEAVGPVIAPSANPEGRYPARTIEEAKVYFGDSVDCYVDGGEVPSTVQASEVIEVASNGEITIIRAGTEKSKQSLTLPIHRSSGGVVFHDNKVLLIHWAPPRDSYDFPKGTIDEGETSEEACVREVFEETGYKTKIVSFIGSNSFDFQTPDGDWKRKVTDYYLLELVDIFMFEAEREPYETIENIWVPIDEAASIITRDINIDIFNKALELR